MFKPCPSRRFSFGEFLIVVGILAFAYYLEFYQGLIPCPLCEAQQLIFAALGLLFLATSLLPARKGLQLSMNTLILLVSLVGTIFSGRQVWLQYLPPEVLEGTCDVSLLYMIKIMPFSDVILNLLLGGPECAKITWAFLGISIAGWALIWFAAFFLLAVWQILGWLFKR